MPFYIIVRSVEGLDGWNGRDLVSLHVMLGIGAPVMLYVQFRGRSDYFSMPRETYQARLRTAMAVGGDSKCHDLSGHAQKHLRLSSSVPQPATDQFRGPRPGNVDAAVITSRGIETSR
jgi:hypothetical protein